MLWPMLDFTLWQRDTHRLSMPEILSTSDYSNWPDWMLKIRIQHIERDIATINKKIEEEENIHKENLKKYEKIVARYEKHKHLFENN